MYDAILGAIKPIIIIFPIYSIYPIHLGNDISLEWCVPIV